MAEIIELHENCRQDAASTTLGEVGDIQRPAPSLLGGRFGAFSRHVRPRPLCCRPLWGLRAASDVGPEVARGRGCPVPAPTGARCGGCDANCKACGASGQPPGRRLPMWSDSQKCCVGWRSCSAGGGCSSAPPHWAAPPQAVAPMHGPGPARRCCLAWSPPQRRAARQSSPRIQRDDVGPSLCLPHACATAATAVRDEDTKFAPRLAPAGATLTEFGELADSGCLFLIWLSFDKIRPLSCFPHNFL